MKQFLVTLFVCISFSSILNAQEVKPCSNEGIFMIERTGENVNFNYIADGEIFPNRNQNESRAYSFFFRTLLRYELEDNPNIIQNSKVDSKLINSKAKFVICYNSFKTQFIPFALGEIDELTLISQKGTPFLTFYRVE